MSDKPSSSKKRSASTAGVGHSDKDSAPKRVRVDTALETRLAKLQQTLSYLDPDWKPFAPNGFMDAMILLHNRFKDMTSTKVKEYIAEGFLNSNLWTLGLHEDNLKEPISSTDSRHYKLTQDARELMTNYVTRVRDCLNALVDQAQVKPAPREFANSRTWRVYQQRSDAILCLRPADKRGLPMPLMHTAFCKFTHHFHEPPLDEHTPKYLSIADKLCQAMPSAFDSESDRRRDFEKIFVALDEKLEQHIEFFLSKKASTAKESTGYVDVAKTIDEGGSVVVLFEEFKVESTGDAYMQICRSYEVLCAETKTEPLLKFGYPAFLLCVLGPYIMVCGAIKRENAHVEPLTPLLPMFPGFGVEGWPVQIAHCLRALKEGLDTLREFWHVAGVVEDVNNRTTTYKLPEPYLVSRCPDNGLLRFGDWQGTFESPMHDKSNSDKPPTFLAKLHKAGDESQRQVVVKFVYNYSGTYGATVHQYLYDLGLAPHLYCAENLHRGLVMVVMEHLSFEEGTGGWVELDTFEGKLDAMADVVRTKLENIIELLQRRKMVHADLRPRNIMVKVDGSRDIILHENQPLLYVVDFDWAGMVGEARYPPFLNPKVPWPTRTEAYREVGEDDDKILLDNWWGAFVKGQPAI